MKKLPPKQPTNNSAEHTNLCNKILAEYGLDDNKLIWLAPVGQFRYLRTEGRISIGMEGQGDIMAVVCTEITPDMVGKKVGIFHSVECKTGNAVLSPAQMAWRARMNDLGCPHVVAHCVEDTKKILKSGK